MRLLYMRMTSVLCTVHMMAMCVNAVACREQGVMLPSDNLRKRSLFQGLTIGSTKQPWNLQ